MLSLMLGTCLTALSVAWTLPADPPSLEIEKGDVAITVSSAQGPLVQYRFADVPFKPYVRELHTPSGVQVLRDSPHDHKHHHALMYAIGVDGVSYWEETERSGRQLHDAFSELKPARHGETATARAAGTRRRAQTA